MIIKISKYLFKLCVNRALKKIMDKIGKKFNNEKGKTIIINYKKYRFLYIKL